MKQAIRFTLMILAFALCQLAAAQRYSIRAEGRYNLRAEPSLQGPWVETVATGTILQVSGATGSWLQIDRNGRVVWMADWLRYTRIEGVSQPEAQTPVDNCCFVDRQCVSDQDWTDGYFAFQAGQCSSPSQPQPQQSEQPLSVSSQVNNCCFAGWHCQTEREWIAGYHAYQSNQCAVGSGNQQVASPTAQRASAPAWTPNMTAGVKHLLANPSRDPFDNCCFMHWGTCHSEADWQHGQSQYENHQCVHPSPLGTLPSIEGDYGVFRELVQTALELIRIHTPEWLDYIRLSGVRKFELMPADVPGGFFNQQWSVAHGFYSWQQNDPNWRPNPDYVAGYAGGITHEACHAIQQRTYSQTIDWANELPCVEAQLAVIEAIKPDSKDIGWLSGLVGHPDTWRR